ncbi:MAG TPA: serine/threonine-protein kinase [Steroidobacteraceae bacterium]|nr:serine/threonine-protein kinase [Steroidobacteraceae bacterium]
MTPERWRQISEVFAKAVDADLASRSGYLEEACRGDPQLLREVESLLAAHGAPDAIVDRPAVDYVDGLESEGGESRWVGRTLGAYKVISLLATGGMGEVYRAVRADGLYPQAVAVKLIRRELAGAVMLDRFRAEREILAAMEHPNIARILDAGITDSDLPYTVMELVEGEPIDRFCEHQGLTVRQRLELFIDVCAAVHFAHQHLTVHRDLKPANILVTKDGVVKLVDFGIAKVLDAEGSGDVLTSLHAMTPEYSSPEQIRREPITTATDIYSLGVILYRLVTGHSPYSASGNDPYALAREVCDSQPARPSASLGPQASPLGRGQVRGDLDSIVLMALRKEPGQRYPSAQEFAADVRRYLDKRPVAARPRSWRYTASRFIARNRAVSVASALLLVVLVGGILATQRQARIAAAERDRAQRHFDSVRQLANSFMFELHDEIAKLPGSNKARQMLVSKSLTYLDLLARESAGDTALQLELAEAYVRVGGVQGAIGFNNLGDHAAALKSFQQASALLERALAPDPASRPESLQLSRAYNLASGALAALGKPQEEAVLVSKDIDLMQRRLARVPDSLEVSARLGHALYRRSHFRSDSGDLAGASTDAQRAVDVYERIVAKDPQYKYRNNLVFAYSNLGEQQLKSPDASGRDLGIASLRKALVTMQAAAADMQDDVNARRHLAVTAGELGESLVAVGRAHEALPYVEQTLPIFQALYDADRTNRLARLDLADAEENAGALWVALGDPTKAIAHCRTAVRLLEPAPEPPDSNLEISSAYIEAQTALAQAYAAGAAKGATPPDQAGLWREARASAATALHMAQSIVAKKPEIAASYADFIAKDQSLLADHASGQQH